MTTRSDDFDTGPRVTYGEPMEIDLAMLAGRPFTARFAVRAGTASAAAMMVYPQAVAGVAVRIGDREGTAVSVAWVDDLSREDRRWTGPGCVVEVRFPGPDDLVRYTAERLRGLFSGPTAEEPGEEKTLGCMTWAPPGYERGCGAVEAARRGAALWFGVWAQRLAARSRVEEVCIKGVIES